MGNNLTSPNSIATRPSLEDLSNWFDSETASLSPPALQQIARTLARNLEAFVRFPSRALLLWHGCDRIVPAGQKTKYHRYPDVVKEVSKSAGVYLDSRANGPAIAAFQLAGGERPERFGSSNAWSVHHLYSGKFPFPGRSETMHAAKSGAHFTQSAGLVAVHPLADALSDELPALTWLLRAEAFRRFEYDPDGVFGLTSELGFAATAKVEIIYAAS